VFTGQPASYADFNGNPDRLFSRVLSPSAPGKHFEPNHKQRIATTNCKATVIGFFDGMLHRDRSMRALFKSFGIG